MNRSIQEIIEHEIFDLGWELQGLSHLFDNFKSEGSGELDNERMKGIGSLFNKLAKQVLRIHELMDASRTIDTTTKVEIGPYEWDPLGVAEDKISALKGTKFRSIRENKEITQVEETNE